MNIEKPKTGVFLISRRSEPCQETPPCDGAYRVWVQNIDVRTTDDPKKVPAYRGDDKWWYSKGENHRMIDGKIARDIEPIHVWVVRIDDLAQFAKKHGSIIIDHKSNGWATVEICDD